MYRVAWLGTPTLTMSQCRKTASWLCLGRGTSKHSESEGSPKVARGGCCRTESKYCTAGNGFSDKLTDDFHAFLQRSCDDFSTSFGRPSLLLKLTNQQSLDELNAAMLSFVHRQLVRVVEAKSCAKMRVS